MMTTNVTTFHTAFHLTLSYSMENIRIAAASQMHLTSP